mmetsp:Transcript_49552/g.152940  ORF Transcript_49552/g.152940 Transcript_49552/m.152940 type:complete len:781 (+) Transcript_49552:309-2651(+)
MAASTRRTDKVPRHDSRAGGVRLRGGLGRSAGLLRALRPCWQDAVGQLQDPVGAVVGSDNSQHAHEEEVPPDPGPRNGEDEEKAKLGEELQGASEQDNGGHHGGHHPTEDAHADVVKGLLEFLCARGLLGVVEGVRQVDHVVHREARQDRDADRGGRPQLVAGHLHHRQDAYQDGGDGHEAGERDDDLLRGEEDHHKGQDRADERAHDRRLPEDALRVHPYPVRTVEVTIGGVERLVRSDGGRQAATGGVDLVDPNLKVVVVLLQLVGAVSGSLLQGRRHGDDDGPHLHQRHVVAEFCLPLLLVGGVPAPLVGCLGRQERGHGGGHHGQRQGKGEIRCQEVVLPIEDGAVGEARVVRLVRVTAEERYEIRGLHLPHFLADIPQVLLCGHVKLKGVVPDQRALLGRTLAQEVDVRHVHVLHAPDQVHLRVRRLRRGRELLAADRPEPLEGVVGRESFLVPRQGLDSARQDPPGDEQQQEEDNDEGREALDEACERPRDEALEQALRGVLVGPHVGNPRGGCLHLDCAREHVLAPVAQTAARAALEVVVVEDDACRKPSDDQDVVGDDDKGREDAKGLDVGQRVHGGDDEGAARRGAGDEHGPRRAAVDPIHARLQVDAHLLAVGGELVLVHEDKDVVGANGHNDEEGHEVETVEVLELEDHVVEEERNGDGQDDLHDASKGNDDGVCLDPEPDEDQHQTHEDPEGVKQDDVQELAADQRSGKEKHLDAPGLLRLLQVIAELLVKPVHKLLLLVVAPVVLVDVAWEREAVPDRAAGVLRHLV